LRRFVDDRLRHVRLARGRHPVRKRHGAHESRKHMRMHGDGRDAVTFEP
jgi:hypothetical protein